MEEVNKIRSHCRICHGGCGVLVHVKDGKVIRIEGDPESPISRGTLCPKGIASVQFAYHPDRLVYPLETKGAKGGVYPRFTKLADRSDLWPQLRPGTDVALALGMLCVCMS
jgi:anaerobic selenocysteine-containing dehydrogenase